MCLQFVDDQYNHSKQQHLLSYLTMTQYQLTVKIPKLDGISPKELKRNLDYVRELADKHLDIRQVFHWI